MHKIQESVTKTIVCRTHCNTLIPWDLDIFPRNVVLEYRISFLIYISPLRDYVVLDIRLDCVQRRLRSIIHRKARINKTNLALNKSV